MVQKSRGDYLLDELKATVTNMNNPTCHSCNECCSIQTLITEEEFLRLKDYFESDANGRLIYKNAKNRLKRYIRQSVAYLMCPFTDEQTKKCRIYENRPQICRCFHCNPIDVEKSKQVKKQILSSGTVYELSDLFEEFYKEHPFARIKGEL